MHDFRGLGFSNAQTIAASVSKRMTTLEEAVTWLRESDDRSCSCVINLPYQAGEQTAEDLISYRISKMAST